uniref:NB-ARC domain-containing protein n=1 Tax=Oryza rufipogon TaxID=4529 RepID=A0A0E0MWZ8_ORYRU
MEIFRALQSVLGKLSYVIELDKNLTSSVKSDLRVIKNEMAMMNTHISSSEHYGNLQDAIDEQWILQLQELAYDMEDSIDTLYRTPKLWFLRRSISIFTGTDHRPGFINEVQSFKERLMSLKGWKSFSPITQIRGRENGYLDDAVPSVTQSDCPWLSDNLVGIDQPKLELLNLLMPEGHADSREARQVVSIVGHDGLGKTTLAKAVFHSEDIANSFPDCRIWVVASDHSDLKGLLVDILCKVDGGTIETRSSLGLEQIRGKLRSCLQKTRYFIVIDDLHLQAELTWIDIESALPKSTSNRIIITTSILSVANACSRGSYVYKMQGLNKDCSKTLFWNNVYGHEYPCPLPPDLERYSEGIFNKCDGSPLALRTIGRYLYPQRNSLTGKQCQHLVHELGTKLARADCQLEAINRVLHQRYNRFLGHGPRACLLSLSMLHSKSGRPIKTKSLLRRWLAEGFVVRYGQTGENDAHECFKQLIDQSILDAVEIRYNSEVKRSQLPGLMLEFLIQKSISINFFTAITEGNIVRGNSTVRIRRVSIQDITKDETITEMQSMEEFTHVRSLTLTNSHIVNNFSVIKKTVDSQDCNLIRVLDIEKCTGVTADVLDTICNLFRLLKYLSIRDSDADKIPPKIQKLVCLETLDIRGTDVVSLPLEVFKLPMLVHMFGKVKLPSELKKVKGETNICDDHGLSSRILETLAGFCIDDDCGFEKILEHMKFLKKVKIWCSDSPPSDGSTELLVSCLNKRIEGRRALESMSIDFGNNSIDFINNVNDLGMLSSVKLRGNLTSFPNFISPHDVVLSELHLVSTGLPIETISNLQNLTYLEYLRVEEENDRPEFWDRSFVVRSGGFLSLRRLCLAGPKVPRVQIERGAMLHLTSLYLLSGDYGDEVGVRGIAYLNNLNEVMLHPDVSKTSFEAWKAATMSHKNRPYVRKAIRPEERGNRERQ